MRTRNATNLDSALALAHISKDSLTEVSYDAFYAPIYAKNLDVHPHICSDFPYTDIWRLRNGKAFGVTEDYLTTESGLPSCRYYLLGANQ